MVLRAAIVPVTPFRQNCAILWEQDTMRGVVVDPGEAAPVLVALRELGVAADRVLLTHGHLDHASGAAEVAETLGIPVEGPHEADRFLLDGLPEAAAPHGFPARAVTPDRWLDEGDAVDIGGHPLAVLHCPGHTPGHVVFHTPESVVFHTPDSVVFHDAAGHLAIVGDVLFRGSVGRTDFPYGDAAALLRAIRGKLFPMGDDTRFLCGHGPEGTIGEERRTNPFVGPFAGPLAGEERR